jgi:flagellar hook-associated protein 2
MKFKAMGVSTLEVKGDTDAMQTAIDDFITAYNAVVDALRTDTAYDPATKTSGQLLHYSSVRHMNLEMQSFATAVVPGLASSINSLASIGIDTTKEGKLKISDQAVLTSALTDHLSDVKTMLYSDPNSITKQLTNYLSSYNDVGGVLFTTAASLDQHIADLLDPLTANADDATMGSGLIPNYERRLASYELSLNLKYSALDALLTTNQSLLSSLSGASLLPSF